jgi:hypothetical protein
MTIRTANCHCGALVLECEGEPLKVSMCHCLDCQRCAAHGAATPNGLILFEKSIGSCP